MSFSDYDITQCYATNYIDLCIKNPKTQHNYCNRWEEKYKNALEKADADEIGLWTIRQNKAIWQMYSSATLMTEAKLHYNNNCFISFYFCLYYSLVKPHTTKVACFHTTFSNGMDSLTTDTV